MTILAKSPPPPTPAAAAPAVLRAVGVFANLLPDEVVASRRARVVKRYVLLGLAATLFLLVTGFGLAWWQTQRAQGDLSAAQDQASALQHRQREFQPLVTAQGQSAQIESSLGKLMVGDLQWMHLLDTIRASATRGISITSLTGTVTVGAAVPPGGTPGTSDGLDVLNRTGQLQVGTMTISGTAVDKNTVAAFVDTLGKMPGLAAAFPASVTSTNGKLTFSVQVILTSDALGGRFTPKPATTGGH
jgi:Tfp pilus assembly protein PilN